MAPKVCLEPYNLALTSGCFTSLPPQHLGTDPEMGSSVHHDGFPPKDEHVFHEVPFSGKSIYGQTRKLINLINCPRLLVTVDYGWLLLVIVGCDWSTKAKTALHQPCCQICYKRATVNTVEEHNQQCVSNSNKKSTAGCFHREFIIGAMHSHRPYWQNQQSPTVSVESWPVGSHGNGNSVLVYSG